MQDTYCTLFWKRFCFISLPLYLSERDKHDQEGLGDSERKGALLRGSWQQLGARRSERGTDLWVSLALAGTAHTAASFRKQCWGQSSASLSGFASKPLSKQTAAPLSSPVCTRSPGAIPRPRRAADKSSTTHPRSTALSQCPALMKLSSGKRSREPTQ